MYKTYVPHVNMNMKFSKMYAMQLLNTDVRLDFNEPVDFKFYVKSNHAIRIY